jgi:hypothetical protein
VESEGPQSSERGREPPSQANVIQFGDWIGPRDELVPFGPRQRTRGGEISDELSAAPLPTPSDSPPSACDFWGERAASLQGPILDCGPVGADSGMGAHASTAPPTPRARAVRGRRLAAVAACGVVAALVGVVLALVPLGAGTSHGPGLNGAKLPLAALIRNAVDRNLTLAVPRIAPRSSHASGLPATRAARVSRKASRGHSVSERVRYTRSAQKPTTASFHPTATASSARVSPAPTGADTAPATTSAPPSTTRATSSSAAVSPTGESGALGPIQSPNG